MFFNEPKPESTVAEGMMLAIHNMLTFYYLSLSKSFDHAWRLAAMEVRADIAFGVQKKRLISAQVRMNSKLYSLAKQLFGDDIV